jgi:hypothetical protein
LHELRPGDVSDGGQRLECAARIRLPGHPDIEGRYLARVGPFDALKLTEGATFPCRANPAQPRRVGAYLYDDLDAEELSGRFLDFRALTSGRSETVVAPPSRTAPSPASAQ